MLARKMLAAIGLDWTDKYPSATGALANLNLKTAYIDGELCGVYEAGLPSFAHTQAATDGEREVRLVYTPSISCISTVGTSRTFSSSSARRFSSRYSRTSPAFSSMVMRLATANSSGGMPASSVLRARSPRRSTRLMRRETAAHGAKPNGSTAESSSSLGWSDLERGRPGQAHGHLVPWIAPLKHTNL